MSAAASFDDRVVITELVQALEKVAVGYNTPAGYSGMVWQHQFDYWKQIGYELLLGLVGLLLRDRRFDTLGEVLRTLLHIPKAPKGGNDQVTVRYLNPGGGYHQQAWGQSQLKDGSTYISPIGQLLKERYSRPPLSDVVSWGEIQAADLLLSIWSAARPDSAENQMWPWISHAAVLMTDPPRFLTDAIRVGPARQVAQALGLANPEALRDL